MVDFYSELIVSLGKERIIINELLSKYTSFRIGGPADYFYRAQNLLELVKAVKVARKIKIPFFILGGGTNLLVSDKGFRGLVIKNESGNIKLVGILSKNKISGKRLEIKKETVYIEADSGIGMNRLVRYMCDQGFSGMEPFLGQPGTVGGAIYMNAHNMKMKKYLGDLLIEAKLLTGDGIINTVTQSYFRFSYDSSKIQQTKEIILSAVFKMERSTKEVVWQRAQKASDYRKQTQPYGHPSAGCIFRNISQVEAMRSPTPNYTCSAGYLLDQVGLKGYSKGEAAFSKEHVNFILNYGHAKAEDVLKLINIAKEKVKSRFNIDLETEIQILGEE